MKIYIKHSEPIFGMATVGRFQIAKGNKPKGNEYKVFTASDNHPTTHVHALGDKKVCIKLNSAEYFPHDAYKDKFSAAELTAFIEFMKSPCKQRVFTVGTVEYKLKTNWDYTIATWNEENPEFAIKICIDSEGYMIPPRMPPYEQLR